MLLCRSYLLLFISYLVLTIFFDCFCNFINIRIDKRVWQPRIVGKENTKVVK